MKKGILLAALLVGSVMSMNAQALTQGNIPYTTYNYTYYGEAVKAPHAYTPAETIAGIDWQLGNFQEPSDMKIYPDGRVIVSDTGNNRIVILPAGGGEAVVLDRFGEGDTFQTPKGICLDSSQHLYVCDMGNQRVLEFDENLALVRKIGAPDKELLPDGFNFSPSHIAVDATGRLCIISEETIYGIMVFSAAGNFEAFIGAQKVVPSISDQIWRRFMTREQRERTVSTVPINYNNLVLDQEGFLLATSISPYEESVAAAITNRSKESTFAPIKRLTPNGEDILQRQGFFPPAGDVKILFNDEGGASDRELYGPSHITTIASGPDGLYSAGDVKRNKIFTYDESGNLLYVFGGTGYQTGLFQKITALAYYGEDLYVLDGGLGRLTRFEITDYGRLIGETIRLTKERKYTEAAANWEKVVDENAYFTLGHIGIGNACMKAGEYQEAMDSYKKAYYFEGYSKAYGLYRDNLLDNWILALPIAIGLLCFLLAKLLGKVAAYNVRTSAYVEKRPLRSQLAYAFHPLTHPFDGFWDIKHEKRGGLGGALVILAAALGVTALRQWITGYLFTKNADAADVGIQLVLLGGFVLIFCLANWCLTTLMDGEGSFKDIFITVCYALFPVVLFSLPIGLLSNVLVYEEAWILSLLNGIMILWTALLIIAGLATVNAYSMLKNLVTLFLTLVGVIIIVFIGYLAVYLIGQMISFGDNIFQELSYR